MDWFFDENMIGGGVRNFGQQGRPGGPDTSTGQLSMSVTYSNNEQILYSLKERTGATAGVRIEIAESWVDADVGIEPIMIVGIYHDKKTKYKLIQIIKESWCSR